MDVLGPGLTGPVAAVVLAELATPAEDLLCAVREPGGVQREDKLAALGDRVPRPVIDASTSDPLGDVMLDKLGLLKVCLLYTSPSPRDKRQSRMPSSA